MADLHKKENDLRSTVDEVLNAVNNAKNASNTSSIEKLNHSALMKLNKDTLAQLVEKLSKLLPSNIELCKSAAGTLDSVKTELIEVQREQLKSVKNTVQTEMRSWTDVVKGNCASNAPSLKKMKKVVETAVQDDARSRNFIIHGVPESYTSYAIDAADEILNEIWQHHDHPDIVAVNFIGTKKQDNGRHRPIKVTLNSNESVKMVLGKAPNLKKLQTLAYRTWYITPDRNREEQAAHQKLVSELREKIKTDSTRYHYIKDGKVMSVDKE